MHTCACMKNFELICIANLIGLFFKAILLGFVLYAPSRSMLVLRYNQLGGVWYQRILSLTYGVSLKCFMVT